MRRLCGRLMAVLGAEPPAEPPAEPADAADEEGEGSGYGAAAEDEDEDDDDAVMFRYDSVDGQLGGPAELLEMEAEQRHAIEHETNVKSKATFSDADADAELRGDASALSVSLASRVAALRLLVARERARSQALAGRVTALARDRRSLKARLGAAAASAATLASAHGRLAFKLDFSRGEPCDTVLDDDDEGGDGAAGGTSVEARAAAALGGELRSDGLVKVKAGRLVSLLRELGAVKAACERMGVDGEAEAAAREEERRGAAAEAEAGRAALAGAEELGERWRRVAVRERERRVAAEAALEALRAERGAGGAVAEGAHDQVPGSPLKPTLNAPIEDVPRENSQELSFSGLLRDSLSRSPPSPALSEAAAALLRVVRDACVDGTLGTTISEVKKMDFVGQSALWELCVCQCQVAHGDGADADTDVTETASQSTNKPTVSSLSVPVAALLLSTVSRLRQLLGDAHTRQQWLVAATRTQARALAEARARLNASVAAGGRAGAEVARLRRRVASLELPVGRWVLSLEQEEEETWGEEEGQEGAGGVCTVVASKDVLGGEARLSATGSGVRMGARIGSVRVRRLLGARLQIDFGTGASGMGGSDDSDDDADDEVDEGGTIVVSCRDEQEAQDIVEMIEALRM
jgi:hypothetical protein